jgi:hypothetical protein
VAPNSNLIYSDPFTPFFYPFSAAPRIVRDEHDQIVVQLKEWIADPDVDVCRLAMAGLKL